jgi:hypothetical protein
LRTIEEKVEGAVPTGSAPQGPKSTSKRNARRRARRAKAAAEARAGAAAEQALLAEPGMDGACGESPSSGAEAKTNARMEMARLLRAHKKRFYDLKRTLKPPKQPPKEVKSIGTVKLVVLDVEGHTPHLAEGKQWEIEITEATTPMSLRKRLIRMLRLKGLRWELERWNEKLPRYPWFMLANGSKLVDGDILRVRVIKRHRQYRKSPGTTKRVKFERANQREGRKSGLRTYEWRPSGMRASIGVTTTRKLGSKKFEEPETATPWRHEPKLWERTPQKEMSEMSEAELEEMEARKQVKWEKELLLARETIERIEAAKLNEEERRAEIRAKKEKRMAHKLALKDATPKEKKQLKKAELEALEKERLTKEAEAERQKQLDELKRREEEQEITKLTIEKEAVWRKALEILGPEEREAALRNQARENAMLIQKLINDANERDAEGEYERIRRREELVAREEANKALRERMRIKNLSKQAKKQDKKRQGK